MRVYCAGAYLVTPPVATTATADGAEAAADTLLAQHGLNISVCALETVRAGLAKAAVHSLTPPLATFDRASRNAAARCALRARVCWKINNKDAASRPACVCYVKDSARTRARLCVTTETRRLCVYSNKDAASRAAWPPACVCMRARRPGPSGGPAARRCAVEQALKRRTLPLVHATGVRECYHNDAASRPACVCAGARAAAGTTSGG